MRLTVDSQVNYQRSTDLKRSQVIGRVTTESIDYIGQLSEGSNVGVSGSSDEQ